jgi:hypothetical protein
MTSCIRKTTWPTASIAFAVMVSLSTAAFPMGVGGVGGSAAGHVGGAVGGASGGVGGHGGSGHGVVGGGAGHAGAQRSGWGGPHQQFNRARHGDPEGRRPVPWSSRLWLGNPYSRCQIDPYGRQHCY